MQVVRCIYRVTHSAVNKGMHACAIPDVAAMALQDVKLQAGCHWTGAGGFKSGYAIHLSWHTSRRHGTCLGMAGCKWRLCCSPFSEPVRVMGDEHVHSSLLKDADAALQAARVHHTSLKSATWSHWPCDVTAGKATRRGSLLDQTLTNVNFTFSSTPASEASPHVMLLLCCGMLSCIWR
jgi:hypothetical protein